MQESDKAKKAFELTFVILAFQSALEKWTETIYYAPQTALGGFLYGLMHNESTARRAALDAKLRRKYNKYTLARAITRVKQAMQDLNSHSQEDFSGEELKRIILQCDFTNLKKSLEEEINTQTDEIVKASLREKKDAIEHLENLSLSMRKIIARMKNGDEQDFMKQSTVVKSGQDENNVKNDVNNLAKLLYDKKSIDCDFEVFEFIISLFHQEGKDNYLLPSPKFLDKAIFSRFVEIGKKLRGFLIIQSLKDNHLFNLFVGIIGLAVIMPMYIILGATKTLKSIFVGAFNIVKMIILGVYMGVNNVKKEEIDSLVIDMQKPLNELKSIYNCVFASISQDIAQWDHAGGKNSLMRVIEKLIYEMLTKINFNYKGLIKDESVNEIDIRNARELLIKIEDPQQEENKEENRRKLFDLFENKLAIPFFEISNILQHIHSSGETLRIFVQKSTFTAVYTFTDYVINRRDNEPEFGVA